MRPETTSTRKGALGPATSHCRTPRSAAKEVFAESFLILTMHLVVTTGPQMEPPRTAKGSTVLPLTPRPQRPTAPATAATAAPDVAEVASSEGWLARRACVPNKSPPMRYKRSAAALARAHQTCLSQSGTILDLVLESGLVLVPYPSTCCQNLNPGQDTRCACTVFVPTDRCQLSA